MEYNIYKADYERLKGIVASLEQKKRELVHELKEHEDTDIKALHSQLSSHDLKKSELEIEMRRCDESISLLNNKLKPIAAVTKSILNPFSWFDSVQVALRDLASKIKKELTSHKKAMERLKKEHGQVLDLAYALHQKIAKYESFDKAAISIIIQNVSTELGLQFMSLKEISKKYGALEVELKPVVSQIKDYEAQIEAANRVKKQAELLAQSLEGEDNPYERAMVHQECERLFNEGSPNKLINRQNKIITNCQRDLDKAQKRALMVRDRCSQKIERIVIDGNNLCYEGGTFVGIAPLLAVTRKLHKNYALVIIFDASIRALLKLSDDAVRNKFDQSVKVHVVASKAKADETILDVASDSKFCYVISNDRFGEYRDKAVVRDNRIISHEIVDGKIMIHDLGVNVSYVSSSFA